jgi:pSer/pThr/pTyr-binding forkhead associated (FHA) protein
MEVKLVVVSGKKAGEAVPVFGPKFFIGRADDCQLRPHSEMVSRHHCVVILEEGYVGVRDFGSKNGTVVNGEVIRGEQELKNGDRLRVGDLEFEVQLGVNIGGRTKPKVTSIQEAAARTVESSADEDMDLDKWLSDTDTQRLESTRTSDSQTDTISTTTPDEEDEESALPDRKRKKKKTDEVVGVWKNGRYRPTTENPRDAAADTLKNFFKNRPG